MDDRFNQRRRTTHAPTPPTSSNRRQQLQQNHQQPMATYGYPPPDSVLNVPSPPYTLSYYPPHPQYAYPHPAYSPDGTPFMPALFQYAHPTSPDGNGFSPFTVTPSPSSQAAPSAQNPYAQQYQPLRVSPPMSNPQQYYGYSAYAPTPQYQYYQDSEGQWWYPSQQQQPRQPPPSQPQTYDTEFFSSQDRFSPVVRPDPPPVVHTSTPPVPQPHPQPPPPVPSPATAPSSSRTQSQAAKPSASATPPQKAAIRKPYHPNPPSYRSEWVMWAGNVPSDAKHEELWRFFTKGPNEHPLPVPISKLKEHPDGTPDGEVEKELVHGGVVSIFLISRSSCAFINYEAEHYLRAGIARFNGQSLRPHDPRVPKLVCRVRRREDDLKAGVGGQRGNGMHIKWLKDNKSRQRLERSASITSSQSSTDSISGRMSSLSIQGSSDDERDDVDGRGDDRVTARARGGYHTGSSSSYASTNSSILSRFPKRYFILKSLTQYDLDLSVQRGLWATQKHNEVILDQAFRHSQEVYLIFGVNKSGEFYGYARMAGGIPQPQSTSEQVPWAQRSQPPSSASSTSSRLPSVCEEPTSVGETYFGDRLVDDSPAPMSSGAPINTERHSTCVVDSISEENPIAAKPFRDIVPSNARNDLPQSAPPELTHPHKHITVSTLATDRSLDVRQLVSHPRPELIDAIRKKQQSDQDGFELDRSAPLANMRSGAESDTKLIDASDKERDDAVKAIASPAVDGPSAPDGVIQPEPHHPQVDGRAKTESWGEPFKVEWLCTDRLPFTRTKHLRNPWNHDREVKVSRDGTEIEPRTGQLLLEEWERMRLEATSAPSPSPAAPAPPTSPRQSQSPQVWRGGAGRRTGGGGGATS